MARNHTYSLLTLPSCPNVTYHRSSGNRVLPCGRTWRHSSLFTTLRKLFKSSPFPSSFNGMSEYFGTGTLQGLKFRTKRMNCPTPESGYKYTLFHLTNWGRVTQICVFNTRLFSLHNTLNYAIYRACLRMVLLTEVYRNLTSLWINL